MAAGPKGLLANLSQVEQVILGRGNAIFSIAPDRPIRAELLPFTAVVGR